MVRSILICGVLAVAPLLTACQEDSGVEAQSRKNPALAQADTEAEAKIRAEYRSKTRAKIDAIDGKLFALHAKEQKATGKEQFELEAKLPDLEKLRDALVNDFEALDMTVPSSWDAAKAKVDGELETLESAVDNLD